MNTMFLHLLKGNAFHTFLLMKSGIILPQELFFQKKCVFQESVYWLNQQQSTTTNKLIANFNQSFIFYEFLYFSFCRFFLVGLYYFWIQFQTVKHDISLNKWQKSFSDVFLKDRPEEYKCNAYRIYILMLFC